LKLKEIAKHLLILDIFCEIGRDPARQILGRSVAMRYRKRFYKTIYSCFLKLAVKAARSDLVRNRDGGVAIYAALTLPVIAGLMGFGLDTSIWFALKRDVRGMADAAAVAAAHTKMQGGTSAEIATAAITEAARNGYDGTGCTTAPCLDLSEVDNVYGNTTETVQVRIWQNAPLLFSNLFIDRVQISAFASSGVASLGSQCVLALNPSAAGAVTFTGNTSANVGCGVTANSDNAAALIVSGSAELIANPVQAHGGISVGGSGSITSDYPLLPFSPVVADPYDGFAIPAKPAACDYNDETVQSNNSASYAASAADQAIRFCGKLTIHGDATFAPGIYFIDGGDLQIGAKGTVEAQGGVTFILTGASASQVGHWDFNGGGSLHIKAPGTDGHPTQGMAIVQDPIAGSSGDNKINGGANQSIDGVIYFPNQKITYNGGSDTVDSCVQIIADTVEFKGNSYLENDSDVCEAVGVGTDGTGGGKQVVLVR